MMNVIRNKPFFTPVILAAAIFSVFNINPVHATDARYTPDNMMSPGVISMAKQCRQADAWAKFASYRMYTSSDLLDKQNALYTKCVSLGYCSKLSDVLKDKSNNDIYNNLFISAKPSDWNRQSFDNKIIQPFFCKNAYTNVTDQDCKDFEKTTIDSVTAAFDQKMFLKLATLSTCLAKGLCSLDENRTYVLSCQTSKDNIKNGTDRKPLSDGDNTSVEDNNRSVVASAKDLLRISLCMSLVGKDNIDECGNDIDNVIDDCVNNIKKQSPNRKITLNDIGICAQKDKNLRTKWKLPIGFNFNANDNNITPNSDDDSQKTPPDDSDQKKCYDNAGLFGFFWCPGLTILTGTLDSLIGLITGGLKWTILANTSTSSKVSGTAQDVLINSWQKLVAVANIVIAVLFLVMLYSYAINTNDALKAYTAKKLLSRLIIVTIAVNLSFYICAALADLSNLAGTGIYDLINKIIGDTTGLYSKGNLLDEISGVIVGAALIAIALMSLQAASLALLIILALISLRQIALVVLVIISPIAFACYLLPNTEKWFKHWWDAYVRLLIVYPMFMAVWVSSRLMLALLQDIGQNDLIKTALASVAPLLAIIPIFKLSGSIMGKMTSGLQGSAKKHGLTDRASKNDAARRQRAKNFARRKSIALQNNLARKSSAAKAAGNTGAGLIAGGMSVIISHLNGTRAAAADQREQVKRDKLMKDATKSINKAYDKKLKEKRDDDVTAKMPDIAAQAATTDNEIADNQVAQVANTVGTPAIITSTSTGKPTLAGSVMVKYMAMTGKDLSGKQLDSTTYQSVIRYANAHNILNNSELNTALYNVQKNGDKLVRDEFITDYSKNNKTPLFANKKTQKDFIEQTGDFSKENLTSIDKVVEARNKARRSFIDTMGVDTYVNLHQEQRVSLIEQSKQNRDVTSIKNIIKINSLVADYSNVKSLPPITLKHTENIKRSLAGWNKGMDDGKWRSWK